MKLCQREPKEKHPGQMELCQREPKEKHPGQMELCQRKPKGKHHDQMGLSLTKFSQKSRMYFLPLTCWQSLRVAAAA